VGENQPANDTADDIARRKRDVDIKGLEFRETCSLEEDNGVSKEGISAKDLGRPYNTVL
jgi:hypothetical protein